MNTLPTVIRLTDTVTLSDGQTVAVRGLSRTAVRALDQIRQDGGDADRYVIAQGVGVTDEAAQKWLDDTGPDDATAVVKAVLRVSSILFRDAIAAVEAKDADPQP